MSIKLHEVERTPCFKIVAKVLGKKKARKELRKVIKTKDAYWDKYSLSADTLGSAFIWKEAPQGHEFWEGVSTAYYQILKKEWTFPCE